MRYIIFLIALFVVTPVYAAPSVSGTSGSTTHGGEIVIAGTSFGTKSPAAPLLWDDFEWGSDGTLIDSSSDWRGEDSGSVEPEIDISQSFGQGTRSAYRNLYNHVSDTGTHFRNVYHDFSTPSAEIYASYRWRMGHEAGTPSDYGIYKGARIGFADYYDGPAVGYTSDTSGDSTGNTNFWYYDETGSPGSNNLVGDYGPDDLWDIDTWFRIEAHVVASTPGVADGTLNWWIDNVDFFTFDWEPDVATRDALNNEIFNTFTSGHMMANAEMGFEFYVWLDDVYLDNTLARVEICAESTWAGRANCAIQIPSAWSATEATVTLNQGALADIVGSYLYVVDSTGAVNSSGLLIEAEEVVGTEGRSASNGDIDELGW